ncbi:hypothetical protein PF003_g24490 [Phytophthora fragariae]|nr:hypothetical protein PF003_g24490 [Phytophthora fragariae]
MYSAEPRTTPSSHVRDPFHFVLVDPKRCHPAFFRQERFVEVKSIRFVDRELRPRSIRELPDELELRDVHHRE